MQVFIKLIGPLGSGIGPTFLLTPNVGNISPSSASTTNLLNGITVNLSDSSATFITLTSTGGSCDTSIIYNIYPTTTTTSSSTTTSTTDPVCQNTCYKLTNTASGIPFIFSYTQCDGFTTSDTIQPLGQVGSILYICSNTIPIFTVPLGTTSVIVEPILNSNSEINNCPSPCYSNNLAEVIDREICKSSIELLFDLFKQTLPGQNLNNLSGPTLLKTYLSCPGRTVDRCAITGFEFCDIECSPLFLGGKDVQQQFITNLTPQSNCYSSDLGNCCWVHISNPADSTNYCINGGIQYTDVTPGDCYECLGSPVGSPTPEGSNTFCIDNFGVKVFSNCDAGLTTTSTHPLDNYMLSTYSDLVDQFSGPQLQDILNLNIIESGNESFSGRSLLTAFYEQLNGLPVTIKYEYLKAILEVGLVITQGGWGGCEITISSVDGYLCQNQLPCTTTSTTSTSTTTTSSTTTTTTCQCNLWNISISQTDLDNSSDVDEDGEVIPGAVIVSYKNCEGLFDEAPFETAGSYPGSLCSCCTPVLWYFDNGNYVESTLSTATSAATDCSVTTTTTVLECACISITGASEDCPVSEGTYIDCDGATQNYFLPFGQTKIICTQIVPGSKFVLGGPQITQNSGLLEIDEEFEFSLTIDEFNEVCPCGETPTTTTTSTTTTTTCACFITGVVAVNTDCDPCEKELLATVKYIDCEGFETIEQIPSGILTTLQTCARINSVTAVTGTSLREVIELEPCCLAEEVEEENIEENP